MTCEIDVNTPLGQLAAEHPHWLPIFDRFGLDYCCHGSRTLLAACESAGVHAEDVLGAICEVRPTAGAIEEREWLTASMTELADHIEATHHARARDTFTRLATLVPRVQSAHAERHPWLVDLRRTIESLAEAMHDHMVREERVLFPWLRRLDRPSEIHTGPPWSVKRPISCMVHDHDEVAEMLGEIKGLTSGYATPPEACGSFRTMIELLRQLDEDTRRHIHKENNILFPAGVQAEQAHARQAPFATDKAV